MKKREKESIFHWLKNLLKYSFPSMLNISYHRFCADVKNANWGSGLIAGKKELNNMLGFKNFS